MGKFELSRREISYSICATQEDLDVTFIKYKNCRKKDVHLEYVSPG